MGRKLKREFYHRPTLKVAKELLGKFLVVYRRGKTLSGKIVETEAYIGSSDPACHASKGMTPRNKVMFGPPGHAYIYFTYGMYHCLNLVTEKEGFPAAVLIRAIEPVQGMELMARRRGTKNVKNLASGPGKLCQALGLDRSLNGEDLCSGSIWIEDRAEKAGKIKSTSRVGVTNGKNKKWRLYIYNSEFVSKR
ncbi:MAG: DNA-3-methyladenine glycosylase [Candidatus Zixiibacteriota bacterium]